MIDTSIIVRIERGDESLDDFITSLKGEDSAISSITASELLVGVLRAAPESRRTRRQAFTEYVLDRFPILTFDLEAARVHAKIWTELTESGNKIGAHDLMIAATAIANSYAVLTENVREFSRVPGIELRGLT